MGVGGAMLVSPILPRSSGLAWSRRHGCAEKAPAVASVELLTRDVDRELELYQAFGTIVGGVFTKPLGNTCCRNRPMNSVAATVERFVFLVAASR